ncbi:DUF1338 family protein [Nonomuraea sp. NPDC050643]|uniref:2-oxoadipate dioxygenase/decarboxylase family protein n=1 Tax=Nonomuraea sp. NPDC050643 TaxID=3155660 RepID=UPI0033CD7ADB
MGTPAELEQVARIFGAMGMYPVGYYDLREAAGSSVPVVSTAFRPVDPAELAALLAEGWITARPIVYEDFLPRSAAGIFQSNLTSDGSKDMTVAGAELGPEALAGVLGRPLHDAYGLYAAIQADSLAQVRAELGPPGEVS